MIPYGLRGLDNTDSVYKILSEFQFDSAASYRYCLSLGLIEHGGVYEVRLFFYSALTMMFPYVSFADNNKLNIPIILYHNLNPTVPGSMTVTPQKFEANLKLLKDNGFTFIPLKDAVEYLQGKRDYTSTKTRCSHC